MSDYYRDRCRHGGILSNNFIKFWWNRQVVANQYGRPRDEAIVKVQDISGDGPMKPNSAPESVEGNLPENERANNSQDQTIDNQKYHFRDEEYYASKKYNMSDIQVPLLSVGNWRGILLHLLFVAISKVTPTQARNRNGCVSSPVVMICCSTAARKLTSSSRFSMLSSRARTAQGGQPARPPHVDLVLRKGEV